MICPSCSSGTIRTPITNNMLDDQVMRRRQCADCGHRWFTVEVMVPDYAVGWCAAMQSKPVLRVPVQVTAKHQEAKDSIAPLREANQRRSMQADSRHCVTDYDSPDAG
jgi:hypothetical protein